MKYSLIMIAAVALAVACGSPSVEESTVASEESAALPEVIDPQQDLVADSVTSPAPASTPATVTTTPAAGAKLNPPHGEPGHDCAVPVGSPLPDNNVPGGIQVQSPPPANISTPPAGQTPTSVITAPAQTGTVPSGPGLNPAHGEPGHDCAIPVGAPLKK